MAEPNSIYINKAYDIEYKVIETKTVVVLESCKLMKHGGWEYKDRQEYRIEDFNNLFIKKESNE